jgi:hypothetical protein
VGGGRISGNPATNENAVQFVLNGIFIGARQSLSAQAGGVEPGSMTSSPLRRLSDVFPVVDLD